jgi:hypothetical protein
MARHSRIRPGDYVRVKTPDEILQTLDENGAIDHVPFMPEMIAYCGREFRVAKRVVKTCSSGAKSEMRAFRTDDVLLLESVRCLGSAHDGCQKACAIFWREAWLRKLPSSNNSSPESSAESCKRLQARLKTKMTEDRYFCQASEILRATDRLSRQKRFTKCFDDIRAGNCGPLTMLHQISIWLFWRARRVLFGPYARGKNKTTPAASLSLQPGELVRIRPINEISQTLNEKAFNRGLYFSPDMRKLCGREQRIERRLEKIIVDGTGEMRRLRNTVYLEDSPCGCAHVAFGGCSRCEFSYWREIWLDRLTTTN